MTNMRLEQLCHVVTHEKKIKQYNPIDLITIHVHMARCKFRFSFHAYFFLFGLLDIVENVLTTWYNS